MVTRQSDTEQQAVLGTVLVVDDNIDLIDWLERTIKAVGFTPECVPSGEDAVAHASTRHYSMILMDLGMPGIGGIAAAAAIRTLAHPHCDVPIVAMTGRMGMRDEHLFRKAAFNGSILKPFTRQELKETIQHMTRLLTR